jgi:hypothetical protein
LWFDGSDVGAAGGDLKGLHFLPNLPYHLLATFDRNITLGGVVRTPNRATACAPGFWGSSTSCTWGVAHQGLNDPDLAGAILDGYDEGSSWWPVGINGLAPDSSLGK